MINLPATNENICQLCGRDLAGPTNKHHLVPLSKGGRNTPTIVLHNICHNKIHAVFTEAELKRYYNTIERLKENEEIQRFIKWVQKKEPTYYDRSVKMKK
jgi:5-methylcytosine-specific restriction endonuclease McrA